MTVSTFPVWVILSVVFIVLLVIIANVNYYLPRMSKLRAKCVVDKSIRKRNNTVLRMKRRIDEDVYYLIAFLMYAIISICFLVENHGIFHLEDFLFFKVLGGFLAWLFSAMFIVSFVVAFMKLLQENAMKDLKSYYYNHYGVTIVYLHEHTEKEYQEFELSN